MSGREEVIETLSNIENQLNKIVNRFDKALEYTNRMCNRLDAFYEETFGEDNDEN